MLEIQSSKIVLTLVDSETGELFTKEATFGDFKEVTKKATTTRKPKTDDEPTPMVHLLEGKIQLNTKAIEITGFEPDMKIDIRFEKKGKTITPIMLEDADKGNRLTKTHTISCKGTRRDNLVQYGMNFEIVPYEGKIGYFKLVGDAPEKEDDIVEIPEEIQDPEEFDSIEEDFDLDLED